MCVFPIFASSIEGVSSLYFGMDRAQYLSLAKLGLVLCDLSPLWVKLFIFIPGFCGSSS